MTEDEFRAAVARDGYDAPTLIEREADLCNEEHSHDFALTTLILAGELCVTTATGTTTCRAGDTFTLARGVPHSEAYGPRGARLLLARRDG